MAWASDGGGKQLDGETGVTDSAGGVEHRGKTKTDVVAVETFAGKLGGFDEGLQAGQFGVGKQAQAEAGQGPVFAAKLHNIGDSPHRRQGRGIEHKVAYLRG